MASFEAAAGGGDNGTALGEQSSGFRHVNWDGSRVDGSDPGSTVIESGGSVVALSRSRLQPWGIELGPEVAVANDGFESVNSHAAFTPFTAPNLWAPFNSEHGRVRHRRPDRPVEHAGAGVDPRHRDRVPERQAADTTTIQYYSGDAVLGQVSAPSARRRSSASVPDPVVTRVVITLGTATMFRFNGGTPSPGQDAQQLVAGDDVVLAEPAPARPNVGAIAGVPMSPVLDRFTETNSGATAPTSPR